MEKHESKDATAAVRIHSVCDRIRKNGPTRADVADLIAALDEFLAVLGASAKDGPLQAGRNQGPCK